MKKLTVAGRAENSMQSANFVAILALVTEMARRLNENIAKVQLKPLEGGLVASASLQQMEASKT